MAPTAKQQHSKAECSKHILPIKDALDVLSGRWKLPILMSLTFGSKRFGQISRDVQGITDKMLSKELKELEANQLIKRTIIESFPPAVEYSITAHGKSLQAVLAELRNWGVAHRKKIMK